MKKLEIGNNLCLLLVILTIASCTATNAYNKFKAQAECYKHAPDKSVCK